jgi:fructose/tagatose bisphosphate aldolase
MQRVCTSSCKRNRIKHYKRVLETAAKLNAPVIQFSNGGAQFNAGKGLSMQAEKQQSFVELLNKTYSYFWQKLQTCYSSY